MSGKVVTVGRRTPFFTGRKLQQNQDQEHTKQEEGKLSGIITEAESGLSYRVGTVETT